MPSSKGVSPGPIMTAFLSFVSLYMCEVEDQEAYQVSTLSATGDAEQPLGGSVCIR